MKTQQWSFFLILLYLSSCMNFAQPNAISNESIPLQEFMIGRWEAKKKVIDTSGSYLKGYTVDFHSKDKLNFAMKSPNNSFKDEFEYRFISENVLIVENDRAKGGQWEVHRNQNNLLICIWSKDDCLEFTRKKSQEIWLYALASLVLIVFGIRYVRQQILNKKSGH